MGALAATLARKNTQTLALAIVVVSSLMVLASGDGMDSAALLKFKQSLENKAPLSNWNSSVNPCDGHLSNWRGVLCWNGTIWGLKLEHMRLTGNIDVDPLVQLPYFRTLSLMNNELSGPLPDIKKLGRLKALYLSNNGFSGQIPADAFQGMGSLKRLFMANNEFTGHIPSSLATLPRLTQLRLEGNQFSGPIPDFQQHRLRSINLASNLLEGTIPESLSKMNPDAFSGNKDLCGLPLDACDSTIHAVKKNAGTIIMIVILVVIMVAAILQCLAMFRRKNDEAEEKSTLSANSNKIAPLHGRNQERDMSGESSVHSRRADRADKLTFVTEDIEKFDLNDLLRASAEVLGSGTFGASYKASVSNGKPIVVKRYRHMNNVGREEFHEHMRRLGRLKHPNLLPLAAFYYRREEKLLVYEYCPYGSLASSLHGNLSLEGQGLEWQTRLRIVKGVAKGLAYLYSELPILVPHGHLKSSNVLLDPSLEPLLADYALRPVINPHQAHNLMIAYKSPEYAQSGRTSNKTDIWSFGILILEILTGRFPENYLKSGYDANSDLATWVNKMVTEKKIGEVFDKDMPGAKNSKGEMINLLKIGLRCCEEDVERRLDIKEVAEQIEQLKGDSEEENNNFGGRGNGDEISFSVDR
ncbi:hypothetical protein JCGZ_22569 [Jatropha curcas]|uniref:non-specific serine/threonine protein kinase n=1 Tax=Jatropha curcas TaxID=180498 RepID=A0A067JZQ6_JATCU|nr:pollen receptor-like kinase 5 [Jatropha curcas]KDP25034.1 hypothetical protein JCGZ_22569 [Jatropha curcas]